jgi:hypothetical protein
MPIKSEPRERPFIKMFLSAYEGGLWKDAIPDWVEETQDGAVEVIATRADGTTLAIEHTILQPFVGEKRDSFEFMEALARIDKNPALVMPERLLTVNVPVGAIPKGYDRDVPQVHTRLRISAARESSFGRARPGSHQKLCRNGH